MQQVPLHKQDIERIIDIITENNITVFNIIYDNYESGIGYTLHIEFATTIHDRPATVKMAIVDEKDW